MADQHHHHQHQRPSRLSLPPPASTIPTTITTPKVPPVFTYPPATPTPTPSKHRISSSFLSATKSSSSSKTSSLSFLFLLLFSLRSLYSLLPFLRSSSSSFSLFPFSFLVSLLSFLLALSFSLFFTPSTSYSKLSFHQKSRQSIFSSISQSQQRTLFAKSLFLAVVFLLRFQALRYCGTAAMILAEFSGNVAARFLVEGKNHNFIENKFGSSKVRGFITLFCGLFLLSISWDRIECFPLSFVNVGKFGFSILPGEKEKCLRIWPMLLPFLSGFLGCYEQVSMNWGNIRELGRRRIRLISLFFTTIVLFVPALISMFVFEGEGDSISIKNLGWPLANTVIFGVLLSENLSDEKPASSKDLQREYLVTFAFTVVLELFYFEELSLWGLLLCGFLLWIAVRELDSVYSSYLELGVVSADSFATSIMKPIRHILSERRSRKIALFLLINTAYMVVEFVAGFLSNSLGLISDACHMLFDCAALAIGLYASYISRLPANSQFNYGRGRFEVLSGYVNAVFLVLVGALIVLESFERILDPQEISTNSLLAVSIGGLLVNVVGLVFFHEEHHHAHGGSGSCSHSHSHSHSHGSNSELHSHSHSDGSHSEPHSHSHSHESSCSGSHSHSRSHGSHSNSHSHGSCSDSHSHSHSDSRHHSSQKSSEVSTVLLDSHDKSCSGHMGHPTGHHEQHGCNNGQDITNKDGASHEHHHDHGPRHFHNDHHNHDHHVKPQINESHASEGLQIVEDLHNHDHTRVGEKKHHHHHIDHNMEGIFLHVLADTLGSVGVVVSTLLIKYKGWLVADPACSIFISVLIIWSVIPLLRNSAEVLLQRVPRALELDLGESLNKVMKMDGICGIQNLHFWSLTNTDVVGTLHVHVESEAGKASAKAEVLHLLNDAGIKDLTLQVECVKNS